MPQLSGQTKLIWNYFGFCFSGSSQYGEDLGCKSDDSVGELGVDKEHPSAVYQLQLLRCTVQCSVNDSTPGNIWSLVVYVLSRRHRRWRGGGLIGGASTVNFAQLMFIVPANNSTLNTCNHFVQRSKLVHLFEFETQ